MFHWLAVSRAFWRPCEAVETSRFEKVPFLRLKSLWKQFAAEFGLFRLAHDKPALVIKVLESAETSLAVIVL